MMRLKPTTAALAALLLTGCASTDWTAADTRRELAYQAVNAIDAYQTMHIADRPDLKEGNAITAAIIGDQPSEGEVVTLFASYAVSHWLISRALPPKWRKYWQYGTTGYQGYAVINNCRHDLPCLGD